MPVSRRRPRRRASPSSGDSSKSFSRRHHEEGHDVHCAEQDRRCHRGRGDGFRRRLATRAAWTSCCSLRAVRPGAHPGRITRQFADLPACLPDASLRGPGRTRGAAVAGKLERVDGQHFHARTGAVDHGDPATLHALAQSLNEAGLEHSLLRPSTAQVQWPGLRFDTMVLHHAEVWHNSPVTDCGPLEPINRQGCCRTAFRAEPAVMTTSVARPRMPTILPSFTAMSQPHSVAAQQTGILHPPVHIVLGQPGLEVFVHSGGATPSSHGEFAVARCRQCGQSWRPLVVIGLGMAHRMQPCAWAVRHCRLIRPTMPRM
jgi:hypothetical protein